MRVVAGEARGRRLHAPPGRTIRPTSDRVREAVFNTLGSLGGVEGATVADLFAGTGALGVEALSRGAEAVTFVDSDRTAVATIRANLEATGLEGGTAVQADVLRWLPGKGPFDLVFADPPYAFAAWPDLLQVLNAGLAVLESDHPVDVGPAWQVLKVKGYGGTVVTFARPSGSTA
jgi:16S rRNA (guanine966-N2)-methyltransferase